MKKTILITTILFLLSSMVLFAGPGVKPVIRPLPGMKLEEPIAIDGTYLLGEQEMKVRRQAARLKSQGLSVSSLATQSLVLQQTVVIGDEIQVDVSDMYLGETYTETFVVAKIGTYGIITVTKDAYDSFDGVYYHFANPNGDGSTPWLRTEDLISDDQLVYMSGQFDDVIFPKDTEVFGMPDPRGSEGIKTWVLIHNIRDDAYYLPGATSYVAGYFSASEDTENNKNMMHIDSYDWANRTGPDAARPYLYEGVFAHEFEHLIHFDVDPDEPSWMDEGLADLAGFLCGYGHPAGHIAYYLAFHPITSLTFWGSGLEDYGASYLFALYLYEKFGGEAFISALVAEQANGIAGVDATLDAFGVPIQFPQVFDNWSIANYMDETRIYGGKYGYETLVIGSDDTWNWTIDDALDLIWGFPSVEVPFAYGSDWTGMDPMPYTVHYYRYNSEKIAKLSFDGDDFAGVLPFEGTYEWYSGAEAWAWRGISQSFAIPSTGATLHFYTYYEIEDDWDYGYVEVYDHTTGEWTTLEAPGITTNTLPFPQDNPNVPANREPAAYYAAGKWNAFTGVSGGWMPVTMDLSQFAGHSIDLYFRTWQDGAFTLQMMYVDNIAIPEIGFFDGAENGVGGWTVDQWEITDGKFSNGFGLFTLGIIALPVLDPIDYPLEGGEFFTINKMRIDAATQSGRDLVLPAPLDSQRRLVSVITNHADHILSSHYDFKADLLQWR